MVQKEQWKWIVRNELIDRMWKNDTFFYLHCEMTTRHTLTLSGKVQPIRENEERFSYRTLADKYKISIGSVSSIIKRKTEYMESYEPNESSTKKCTLRDEFTVYM